MSKLLPFDAHPHALLHEKHVVIVTLASLTSSIMRWDLTDRRQMIRILVWGKFHPNPWGGRLQICLCDSGVPPEWNMTAKHLQQHTGFVHTWAHGFPNYSWSFACFFCTELQELSQWDSQGRFSSEQGSSMWKQPALSAQLPQHNLDWSPSLAYLYPPTPYTQLMIRLRVSQGSWFLKGFMHLLALTETSIIKGPTGIPHSCKHFQFSMKMRYLLPLE